LVLYFKIGGKILKNVKHRGKIPSFKIRGAKSRFNQNKGGKIPSFKIGGQNPNSLKIGGVKLHLSQKKIKILIAILYFSKQTTHLTECLYHPCHSSVECTGWLRMVSSQVGLVSNQYWDCR